MTFKRVPILKLASLAIALAMATNTWAVTTVDITGDGTYDDTTLTVDIYANIAFETVADKPLVSGGVTLSYDTAQLTLQNAAKNEAVWYFGTAAAPYPYIDPDNIDDGSVEFIVGRLDTTAPLAGVTGNVKIGTATFSYPTGSLMPTTPATLSLDYAKNSSPNFVNFVTTGQVVLDVNPPIDNTDPVQFGAVTLAQACVLKGDMNNDGKVNVRDYLILRQDWGQTGPGLRGDVNNDEKVNVRDYLILRQDWGKICP